MNVHKKSLYKHTYTQLHFVVAYIFLWYLVIEYYISTFIYTKVSMYAHAKVPKRASVYVLQWMLKLYKALICI